MNQQSLTKTPNMKFSLGVALIAWILWATMMSALELWSLFESDWFMSITMAFGSFIAGATSEGGGAVAFPVMTILFDVDPPVARDFSLMIQSVGMSAAALTIFVTGIRVDLRAIVFASMGAIPGFAIGAEILSPLLTPTLTKMFFVSFWLGFGLTLHLKHRSSQPSDVSESETNHISKLITLVLLGIIGGTATGITGCGIDIIVFSYLVLGRGLDERIATPTSVVLMAFMSLVGFAFRLHISDAPISIEAWNYWWVSIPVVVIGAPLGTLFIARRSRNFIISLLVGIIVTQFIGAVLILPMTKTIIWLTILTFMSSFSLFLLVAERSETSDNVKAASRLEEKIHA